MLVQSDVESENDFDIDTAIGTGASSVEDSDLDYTTSQKRDVRKKRKIIRKDANGRSKQIDLDLTTISFERSANDETITGIKRGSFKLTKSAVKLFWNLIRILQAWDCKKHWKACMD